MKTISCVSTALLTLTALTLQTVCFGQNQSNQKGLWVQIEAANSKVKSSDVTWRAVMTLPSAKPLLPVMEEKVIARAKAKAEEEGQSPLEVSQSVDTAKKTLKLREEGQHITSLLHFIRIGDTVKCDVTSIEAKNQIIDYFDGRNSLSIETQVNGKIQSPRGTLVRDNRAILSHSAPTWQTARFLTGMSLNDQYSPFNPSFNRDNSIIDPSGGKVVVERQAMPGQSGVDIEYPASLSLTLSAQYLPLLYENRNTLYRNPSSGLLGRVLISGYKSYGKSVQFPTHITVESAAFKIEYSLEKAKFNDSVDPSQMRMPPETLVVDSRFGFGSKTVVYKMKDGNPLSDIQVLKLLGEKPQKIVKLQNAHETAEASALLGDHTSARTPLLAFSGVFMLMIGGFLWRKKE